MFYSIIETQDFSLFNQSAQALLQGYFIKSYMNTSEKWENEKLCGSTTPEGRSVFTEKKVIYFLNIIT